MNILILQDLLFNIAIVKNHSTYLHLDLKKRRKKPSNIDSLQQVPLNVVMLYKEIERNGIIELSCKCPRRGPPKKDSQPQNSSQSSAGSVANKFDNSHATTGQTPSKQKIKYGILQLLHL